MSKQVFRSYIWDDVETCVTIVIWSGRCAYEGWPGFFALNLTVCASGSRLLLDFSLIRIAYALNGA